MSVFARYANFFDGTCGRLKQYEYIERYNLQNKRGVCHALCFIYLEMRRNSEKFHLAKEQAPLWHRADELQSILIYGNRPGASPLVSHGIELVALKTGWRIVGWNPSVAPYINLANDIMKAPGKAFILHVGHHACAVFKEKNQGWIRFFDPTYGQVTFKSAEKCSSFISAFLQDQHIQKKYDMPFGAQVLAMHLH
ncbi:YopT-type cysteine protease domain-containing protein [Pseudomonas sp. MWU13-2100]|uniref:YopT-type cysteine protease domain-containing protein n=1 Tax=Pseudomonas sp. MWU13-2100 TaxID=2935075 RepID=UPI00200DF24A|nr:YopT-type cysteine protease domain-containing protein [Pseudomonas sp. MWU13-2100]